MRREPATEVIQELREAIEDEARQLASDADASPAEPTQGDRELERELDQEMRSALAGAAPEEIVAAAVRLALEGVRR